MMLVVGSVDIKARVIMMMVMTMRMVLVLVAAFMGCDLMAVVTMKVSGVFAETGT